MQRRWVPAFAGTTAPQYARTAMTRRSANGDAPTMRQQLASPVPREPRRSPSSSPRRRGPSVVRRTTASSMQRRWIPAFAGTAAPQHARTAMTRRSANSDDSTKREWLCPDNAPTACVSSATGTAPLSIVVPAKAGTQCRSSNDGELNATTLYSRFRGNDGTEICANSDDSRSANGDAPTMRQQLASPVPREPRRFPSSSPQRRGPSVVHRTTTSSMQRRWIPAFAGTTALKYARTAMTRRGANGDDSTKRERR
jgi:hypothetical protein